MRAYPDSDTTLLLGQRRKRGRPLNNTAALIMQPNEANTQAASSTARGAILLLLLQPNLLWDLLNIKNIRKMRNRHNPLTLLSVQAVVKKCLRKKVFIVKTNVIRNNFLEIFEKEKMLKL